MGLGDILILGLGASGEAAAAYCAALADGEVSTIVAIDAQDSVRLRESAERLAAAGVTVVLGSQEVSGSYDLCIASPGIPPHSPLMQRARACASEVISEIEFAYRCSSNPWVAVTGTNGKTTTTALITHLLRGAGYPARSVGNFGPPAIEAVAEESAGEILVAEVSSFQLALTESFHPRVAVMLNITPDHVEWHGSLESYAQDKGRVFANLGVDDVAVIDVDDAGSAPFADELLARGIPVVRVSRHRSFDGGASAVDDVLELGTGGERHVRLVAAHELQILGAHNVSNALAAAAAAEAMGVSAAALREGLTTFRPIEHRLEPVGCVAGVEWFNDSKATNPDAVSKAIESLSDRSFVLLLGGRSKGSDFRPLAELACKWARGVIVFGEAKDEIASAFEGLSLTPECVTGLSEAVHAAYASAHAGESVLLSPGCASFDEFDNYEQRGRAFKRLVESLTEREVW